MSKLNSSYSLRSSCRSRGLCYNRTSPELPGRPRRRSRRNKVFDLDLTGSVTEDSVTSGYSSTSSESDAEECETCCAHHHYQNQSSIISPISFNVFESKESFKDGETMTEERRLKSILITNSSERSKSRIYANGSAIKGRVTFSGLDFATSTPIPGGFDDTSKFELELDDKSKGGTRGSTPYGIFGTGTEDAEVVRRRGRSTSRAGSVTLDNGEMGVTTRSATNATKYYGVNTTTTTSSRNNRTSSSQHNVHSDNILLKFPLFIWGKIMKYVIRPFYWLLIQCLVVEKWFLKKRQSRQSSRYRNQGKDPVGDYYSDDDENEEVKEKERSNTNGSYGRSVTSGGTTTAHSYSYLSSLLSKMSRNENEYKSKPVNGNDNSRHVYYTSTPTTTTGRERDREDIDKLRGGSAIRHMKTNGHGGHSTEHSQRGEIDESALRKVLEMGKSVLFFWNKNNSANAEDSRATTANSRGQQITTRLGLRSQQKTTTTAGESLNVGEGDIDYYSATDTDDETEGIARRRERTTKAFNFCGFLMKLMLLLAALGVFLYFLYWIYPVAASLAFMAWEYSASAASLTFNKTADAMSKVAILPYTLFAMLPALPALPRPTAQPVDSLIRDKNDYQPPPSHYTTPESVISKAEYSAILRKLQGIEETLKLHNDKLAVHEETHKALKEQIISLEISMRQFMTQGKTSQQVFDEIMSFKLGETTDGGDVTLLNMVSLFRDKDAHYEEKSESMQLKMQAIYQKLAKGEKLEAHITQVEEEIAHLKESQNQLGDEFKTEMENLKETIREKRTRENVNVVPISVPQEVDLDKVKEAMMPVMMAEIEQQVKISCTTRDCPDPVVTPSGGAPLPPTNEDMQILIDRAIAKYDADKTGRPDLALEPAGGSILSTRCTKSSHLRNSVVSLWGFKLWSPPNNPRTIIQPGVIPGECWAFEGSIGDVVVKLISPSVITGFTMEHISKTVSPYGKIDSAPYKFQVLGLHSEDDLETSFDYGTYSYEDNGQTLQYFQAQNITTEAFPIVELKILSNHGNLQHTCLYRFRVHGQLSWGGSFTATVQAEQ